MVKRRTERRREWQQPNAAREADAERVRAEIAAAWEDDPAPGTIAPHCERPDCPAIAAYFSGKTWRDVEIGAMRAAAGASADNPLLFLPLAAGRHFLPAFLLAFLHDRRTLGDFAAPLVRTLCPHEGWRPFADTLAPTQQRAVLSFLRYVQRTGYGAPEATEGIHFWERRVTDCPGLHLLLG